MLLGASQGNNDMRGQAEVGTEQMAALPRAGNDVLEGIYDVTGCLGAVRRAASFLRIQRVVVKNPAVDHPTPRDMRHQR